MIDVKDLVLPAVVSREHINVLLPLMDGFVRETTASNIRPFLDKEFPVDKLDEYLNTYHRPSQNEEFIKTIQSAVDNSSIPTETVRDFRLLATILLSRLTSPALTNSLTMVEDMSMEERENLLKSWRDSPIPIKRKAFKTLYSLTILVFVWIATDLHNKAIGFPGRDLREALYKEQAIDDFSYTMLERPSSDGHELFIPNIDVLVIGSGSGAGVVAQTLSEKGHKCLVLEKGKYYHKSEYNFNDAEGRKLYEGDGLLTTEDQLMFLLAGSNFGGGSTVNWSACLKTPFKVRKEWYDDYGIDWAATEQYDQCMDYVWKKMGASSENIEHSDPNKVILEAGEKLGYRVRPIDQNNGGHPSHNCGFCHLGCKHGIKQGSQAFWLREALNNGCQFMDQVKVLRLIHKDGKALAALCQNVETGTVFTLTGPKKFVVSGGSLNTPILLKNSGFKNKHIGSNLKLHPATVILGDFGKEVRGEHHHHPIMTSICTEKDDLDGRAHGARIETILQAPYLQQVFYPWNGSDDLRRNLLRYNSLAGLILIARDTASGTIRPDPKKPDAFIVNYSTNKFDRNALLQSMLVAADLLYIQGAKQIYPPQSYKLKFESSKPKEERSINDEEYVTWRKKLANYPLDSYGSPLGSAHQMSSCRLSGKGPSYGACDINGRLFECKNVYIADASVMPTASGANPMISTMSIARLLALGIAKDLEPQVKL